MRATVLAALAIAAVVPLVTAGLGGGEFYLGFATRIVIFAIAATSLNLILGYGGLVSLGHAAFFGLAAYGVGILAAHGVDTAAIQWPVALAACAVFAAVTGLVVLRTSGIYFIMITLAFAQMLYFLFVSLRQYGGDDGLTIATRSRLGPIDLGEPVVLYYLSVLCLVGSLWFCHRLVASRFGMVIRGARTNTRRMAALGFPVFRYQLVAFVLAGVMCGVAGILQANLTQFVSPSYMAWARSGELIVMVVLGGMGTLFGPVLGAAALLILEEVLADWTVHWMLYLGPIIVLIVLFAKRGLIGLFDRRSPPPAGGHHG
ncbi:MAG: branched-chain amino acid ABC transporter permease [Alphaproteobacteria bacterium]|nr:MAG: branched-chain amino acid ABC transporter permease [Alphaproteobacteria bacterium]